ncbi:type IV toxin-antitoxin system AbiEi family antitoxin [Croceimicrobium sp.]|uniref:type IV toxin-antitoxin system AbiEi family antitoxin n=1 Tax=Croceimicrobium sp. TaxID=2828340 RepID=UPI003BAD4CB2
MSTTNPSKINQLLQLQPKGTVLLASWLLDKGYSFDLQRKYRHSQWLEAIGSGAMIRTGDKVNLEGAIYTLQTQLGLSIHIGAKTALAMQGKSHYLELAHSKAILFGNNDEKLPAWFSKNHWGLKVNYISSKFLNSTAGFIPFEAKEFTINISGPARALLECLYLSPDKQDLVECYDLMESMNNLRPNLVQELLENCTSIKVKRLFLYMAEKARHRWFEFLDVEKINLGKGKRSVVPEGVYIAKYQITVPKTLEMHDQSNL